MDDTAAMGIEVRTPSEDDVDAMVRLFGIAFGFVWKPVDFEKVRPTIELDRFRIAVDRTDIVGVSGSFAFEMTRLVVEADGVHWRLGAGGCRKVRSRPDLVGDCAALSALLLGGVRPSTLVAGRRMTAGNAEALRHADATLVTSPTPYCQTRF